jgi:hypothetical protein
VTAAAIREYFRGYAEAFGRGDVGAIVGLWRFPATVSTRERDVAFDEPAFRRNVEALCEFYRRQGVAQARKTVSASHFFGPEVAAVTTEDSLHDAAGGLIAAWSHFYLLRETGDGIRAFGAVADGEVAAWAARGTPLGKPN